MQAYDQHLNMILGEVEETLTTVEIDDETYEEIVKVRTRGLAAKTTSPLRPPLPSPLQWNLCRHAAVPPQAPVCFLVSWLLFFTRSRYCFLPAAALAAFLLMAIVEDPGASQRRLHVLRGAFCVRPAATHQKYALLADQQEGNPVPLRARGWRHPRLASPALVIRLQPIPCELHPTAGLA